MLLHSELSCIVTARNKLGHSFDYPAFRHARRIHAPARNMLRVMGPDPKVRKVE
jgi:hypothetical protein